MTKAVRHVSELAGLPAMAFPDRGGAELSTGLAALLRGKGADVLDLEGREIVLDAPCVVPPVPDHSGRRAVLRNGRIRCRPGAAFTPDTLQSRASYTPGNPLRLSNVVNIAGIPVGALVEGKGVGREVYVTARDPEAGALTLSQPLWGAPANQDYAFTRFRYALDFSVAGPTPELAFEDLEIDCGGVASGLRLPLSGGPLTLERCRILDARDRAITSAGNACAGLRLSHCRVDVAPTSGVALNVNACGARLSDVTAEGAILLMGGGHVVDGCDLRGGLTMSGPSVGSLVTGNRFPDATLELTDEHSVPPAIDLGCALGGLSVAGNLFTAENPAPDFRWIVLRPHGPGQILAGLSVTGNTFAATGGAVARVEAVDDRHTDLDLARTRAVTFDGNVFDGVTQPVTNPVTLEFHQAENAIAWTLNMGDHLPFNGHARTVISVVANGPIRTAAETVIPAMPAVTGSIGPRRSYVRLSWPEPCRGKVLVTARIDRN